MSYIPSVNIELNSAADFSYIVTENARIVAGNIVNGYNSGHHSFSIIGTYGTGKSSFIIALEEDLTHNKGVILNSGVFGNISGYVFLNIVGDYSSLRSLLASKLGCQEDKVLEALGDYYQKLHKQNKFLFIVIDEFGKILEFAVNNNPEKELYFLQKLSEFINVPKRNAIFITTLHQNFGSYAGNLSENQRNEWKKIKGRFQDIVFAEPVEQLLFLTAAQLDSSLHLQTPEKHAFSEIYHLGLRSKILSKSFQLTTAEMLYPLDPIAAVCLTLAIQRYGQNERSLFSFLSAKGQYALSDFSPKPTLTYNLACVYDYLKYHLYSSIKETSADTTGWRSIQVAIERIEGSDCSEKEIEESLRLIKSIGLLNVFFNGIVVDKEFLNSYSKYALDIKDCERIINILERLKIVRFAKYKSQYILYEGTDLNLEEELFKAAAIISPPVLSVGELAPYFQQKAVLASASYYNTGTPRYFEFRILNEPAIIEPLGDIDGFVNFIFPLSDIEDEIIDISASNASGASIYGYVKNTKNILSHLYEIKKLNYVIENVALDDIIASSELNNQKAYETIKLNEAIKSCITDGSVVWYFRGEPVEINSIRDFNKLLSYVCNNIYNKTPIIRNELFNRQKLSSAISLARVNLLDAMLANPYKEAFGIVGFPPEKTIYYTLFKESGIHQKNDKGEWILGTPTSNSLLSLWDVSVSFINAAIDKPRKLGELIKILQTAPYKLKQGVIDFWIPIFLYLKQQDFALYNGNNYVLNINKEVFELIHKRPNDFSLKAFRVSQIKLEFFNRYRQFLKKEDVFVVSSDSLLETVKPFFYFYRNLNSYAKHTRKFDSPYTAKFRDVLSDATDPVKTFFEDLPASLGYKDLSGEEFTLQYVNLIRNAVHELNSCYGNLINRIEVKIVNHLGLSEQFEEYKERLQQRYKLIDPYLLSPKTRAFLDRILAPSESKEEFIEKISFVISDKPLEKTLDSEENLLIHQILHLFSELERFSAISVELDQGEAAEAFSFELASNGGDFSGSQTYRLPKSKSKKADEVIKRVSSLLTDDEELNICILLKLLNDKIK